MTSPGEDPSDEGATGLEERPVGSRRAFDGRLLRLDVDRVALPGGGTAEREVVRHPGAAAVLPLLSRDGGRPEVVLVRQFRYAVGAALWEIPAGTLEPGETAEACARRELREEAGLVAGELELLGRLYTSPGFTDEAVHVFLAPDPAEGEADPEEEERFRVDAFAVGEAMAMLDRGEIADAKTAFALLRAARRPGQRSSAPGCPKG